MHQRQCVPPLPKRDDQHGEVWSTTTTPHVQYEIGEVLNHINSSSSAMLTLLLDESLPQAVTVPCDANGSTIHFAPMNPSLHLHGGGKPSQLFRSDRRFRGHSCFAKGMIVFLNSDRIRHSNWTFMEGTGGAFGNYGPEAKSCAVMICGSGLENQGGIGRV